MTDLHIEQSPNAPKVDFIARDGSLSIEGRSIPENPGEFYKPLLQWTYEYFKNPCKITTIIIKLEYINSGSSKSLLEFFRFVKEQYANGNQVLIKWHAEEDDESVRELGEHYQYTLKIPFEFIEY